VLAGLFSYTAFFVVVALMVENTNLFVVYSLATITALGVNGLSLALLVWRKRSNLIDEKAKLKQ